MRKHRTFALLFALVYGLTFILFWGQPPWLDALRNYAFDVYQRFDTPPYEVTSPVRIVSIDERSLKSLGQWPWPRSRLADMVDKLQGLGAAAVAFDVIFAEADRVSLESVLDELPDGALATELRRSLANTPSNDARFAGSIAAAPVVLGVTASMDKAQASTWPTKAGIVTAGDPSEDFLPRFASMVLPIPVLRDAARGLGATNWLPDRDQIVRRVPLLVRYNDSVVPSLALEALRIAQGASSYVLRGSNASGTSAFGRRTGLNAVKVGDVEVATGADGSIRPRYTHSSNERYISAADLLAGTVSAEQISGRVILVGTPALGLGDVRSTPLDPVVPGVEIQAEVVEQLLSGQLLSRPDWALGLEMLTTLLFLTLLATTLTRLAPALAALLTLAAMTAIAVGSWSAFSRYSLLIDPTFPCVVIGAAYLFGASLLWEQGLQAERQVRRAFGKYVSPVVVARIAANPRMLDLSGETRDLTILFSDVRSFSTISEGLTARQVAHFLNLYLTPMTDAILLHDGTIDKYIGDAIVAFWNAPLDVPDHTRRAVEAALAMRVALERFNAAQDELGQDLEGVVRGVRIGIGLNFGACSVGNMGSVLRFDYSALGDPMNVAARLEALTKVYGVDLLATDSVVDRTPGFAWLEVDAVKVKGRSATTRLFALFGDEDHAVSDPFRGHAAQHDDMLMAGRAGQFRDAERAARALSERAEPKWSALYVAFASHYAERWTGLEQVTELPETNLAPPSG